MGEVKKGEARSAWTPEPGFFRLRLHKRGPLVPCRIRHEPTRDPETGEFLDRSWYWHGDLAGVDDPRPSPTPEDRVWRIWLSRHERIDEKEYLYQIELMAWTKRHAPNEPLAKPYEAVSLQDLPTF